MVNGFYECVSAQKVTIAKARQNSKLSHRVPLNMWMWPYHTGSASSSSCCEFWPPDGLAPSGVATAGLWPSGLTPWCGRFLPRFLPLFRACSSLLALRNHHKKKDAFYKILLILFSGKAYTTKRT